MAQWKQAFIDFPTSRLCYHRTGGDLPPLVLTHGLTDSALCWTRVARELSHHFDVVMLDARGHGASDRFSDHETYSAQADVAGVIGALGLKNPVVMGHSVGAAAVLDVAANDQVEPALVVLEDPPLVRPASEEDRLKGAEAFRQQVREFALLGPDELIALGHRQYPDWDDEDILFWAKAKHQVDGEAMQHLRFGGWRESIAAIQAPTLLIHGTRAMGTIVNPKKALEVQTLNPMIKTVEVANAGHNIHRENFAGFMAVVTPFLLQSI